jgi:DNA-binding transcriptional ArsR family regulator
MSDLHVSVRSGTGYDLLLAAALISDPSTTDRLDSAAEWRRRSAAADPALERAIGAYGKDTWISLMGLVAAWTDDGGAAATLDAMAAADPVEVVLAGLGYYRRAMRAETPPATIRRAVEGDPAAIREVRRTSFPELESWQRSLRKLLGVPAAEARDELVATTTRWYEGAFKPLEDEIRAAQEREVARARELVALHPLDEVLERVAPGITFAREIDQTRLILVPSTVIDPSFALTDYGHLLVLAYPTTAATSSDEPPVRLVRLAKALGDPLRLRAIRELAREPLSVTDLAARLGVPRTTLQHHVTLLLDARLIGISVDDAEWGKLRARPAALTELNRLAERWIEG